jgi:hypothetical protein
VLVWTMIDAAAAATDGTALKTDQLVDRLGMIEQIDAAAVHQWQQVSIEACRTWPMMRLGVVSTRL